MKILAYLILALTLVTFVSAECGDGKFDTGETCSTCPTDIKCAAGETCSTEGTCKSSGIGAIFDSLGKYLIISLIVSILVVILIVIFIVKKSKSQPVNTEIQKAAQEVTKKELPAEAKKPSLFQRLFKKKEQPVVVQQPQDPIKTISEQPKPVETPLTEDDQQKINNLTQFIKNSMNMGYDIEKIKTALVEKGWTPKHIDPAVKNATQK
jgi:hypothetical protein